MIKEIDTGSPLIAAPMTYTVNGVQYIAILAGSGGGGWNIWMPGNVAAERGNDNRILAFRLDGGATPIPPALAAGRPDSGAAGSAGHASGHRRRWRAVRAQLRRVP